MRKVDAASEAASERSGPGREPASVELVCLALALALVTLAGRIYSAW
jgi:hypothetical protein